MILIVSFRLFFSKGRRKPGRFEMGSNRLGRAGMTGSLLGPELLTVPIPLPFPCGRACGPFRRRWARQKTRPHLTTDIIARRLWECNRFLLVKMVKSGGKSVAAAHGSWYNLDKAIFGGRHEHSDFERIAEGRGEHHAADGAVSRTEISGAHVFGAARRAAHPAVRKGLFRRAGRDRIGRPAAVLLPRLHVFGVVAAPPLSRADEGGRFADRREIRRADYDVAALLRRDGAPVRAGKLRRSRTFVPRRRDDAEQKAAKKDRRPDERGNAAAVPKDSGRRSAGKRITLTRKL